MRLFDGPTTGRHATLGAQEQRRRKSVDVPRSGGAGEANLFRSSSATLPGGNLQDELRQATKTLPLDIPGRGGNAKRLPANANLYLNMCRRHAHQLGSPSSASSPAGSPASDMSHIGEEIAALVGSPIPEKP